MSDEVDRRRLRLEYLIYFLTLANVVRGHAQGQVFNNIDMNLSKKMGHRPAFVHTMLANVRDFATTPIVLLINALLVRRWSSTLESRIVMLLLGVVHGLILFLLLAFPDANSTLYLTARVLAPLFCDLFFMTELINRGCIRERRATTYLFLRAVKCAGVFTTQAILPLVLGEYALSVYVGGAMLIVSFVGVVLMFVYFRDLTLTQQFVQPPRDDDDDREEDDNTNTTTAKMFTVACIIVANRLYWSQRGEYYYTWLFLRDSIGLDDTVHRRIQGIQYLCFAAGLAANGWLTSRLGTRPHTVLIVCLIVSMLARCLQITAYEMTSLHVWIGSAVLSVLSPSAGDVLLAGQFTALGDSSFATFWEYIGNAVTVAAYNWIYYLSPNPFVVTLVSLALGLIVVNLSANIRILINNKK